MGPDQGPYHMKINRFGTLLSQVRIQHAAFHGQAGLGSIQDAIDQSSVDVDLLTRARVKVKKRRKANLIVL